MVKTSVCLTSEIKAYNHSAGDGFVRCIYRTGAIAIAQSVDGATQRSSALRHLLGVYFSQCFLEALSTLQVFFSSYIFNANVMVRVATRPADNPVGLVARKLQLSMLSQAPKLSLPGKLVFPNTHGRFTILGLGDIVSAGKR